MTGLSVYLFWNVGTLLGAVLFARISNPSGISVAPQGYLSANTSNT